MAKLASPAKPPRPSPSGGEGTKRFLFSTADTPYASILERYSFTSGARCRAFLLLG